MEREKVEVNGITYEVFYRHLRYVDDGFFVGVSTSRKAKANGEMIHGRGGFTECFLVPPDGLPVFGEAECNVLDNFNKKIGRDISRGRAIASLKKDMAILRIKPN